MVFTVAPQALMPQSITPCPQFTMKKNWDLSVYKTLSSNFMEPLWGAGHLSGTVASKNTSIPGRFKNNFGEPLSGAAFGNSFRCWRALGSRLGGVWVYRMALWNRRATAFKNTFGAAPGKTFSSSFGRQLRTLEAASGKNIFAKIFGCVYRSLWELLPELFVRNTSGKYKVALLELCANFVVQK